MDVDPRLLNPDGIQRVFDRVRSIVSDEGTTHVRMLAWWRGALRWGRSRITLASERRDYSIAIGRTVRGGFGLVQTNQLDPDSLTRAIRDAEQQARDASRTASYEFMHVGVPALPYPDPAVWSESTFHLLPEQRAAVAKTVSDAAESHGLLSAGYLELRASEQMGGTFGKEVSHPNNDEYHRHTQAQCSMTVRHPQGVGSGWAGLSGYDWRAIDAAALSQRALQKCQASMNPVAVEPGRYTVILESQAVADLIAGLFTTFERMEAEMGRGPWAFPEFAAPGIRRTKLGMQVVDSRVTLSHDPMAAGSGVVPFVGLRPITLIDHGILRTLAYDRSYALRQLNDNLGEYARGGLQMSGGSATMEELIASTERGIIVTRFSLVRTLDFTTLLSTGLTRDGLWLVTRGAITKAVKNMRFTDSPLFVLNQLEQLGAPVPVFHPQNDGLAPWMIPPLKSNDFSFTSLADAV